MQNFKNKIAVVTGAASGIGNGLAQRCLDEGMIVVLADIEEAALERATQKFAAQGKMRCYRSKQTSRSLKRLKPWQPKRSASSALWTCCSTMPGSVVRPISSMAVMQTGSG